METLQETLRQVFERAVMTPRLVVRRLTEIDAQMLATFCAADNQAYAYFTSGEPNDIGLTLGIFSVDQSKILGTLDFWPDQHDNLRLSYFVLPSASRNGFAAEAYLAARDHLEANSKYLVTYAQAHEANLASIRLLQKAGFTGGPMIEYMDADYEASNNIRFTRHLF